MYAQRYLIHAHKNLINVQIIIRQYLRRAAAVDAICMALNEQWTRMHTGNLIINRMRIPPHTHTRTHETFPSTTIQLCAMIFDVWTAVVSIGTAHS